MNAETLFEALQAIPDHRTKKGRRFELATILVIALAAMLSGANDLLAIARWGRRLSPQALWALGASKKRRKAPCHSTYHYVFLEISPADLRDSQDETPYCLIQEGSPACFFPAAASTTVCFKSRGALHLQHPLSLSGIAAPWRRAQTPSGSAGTQRVRLASGFQSAS